jgi:hypothetical protein
LLGPLRKGPKKLPVIWDQRRASAVAPPAQDVTCAVVSALQCSKLEFPALHSQPMPASCTARLPYSLSDSSYAAAAAHLFVTASKRRLMWCAQHLICFSHSQLSANHITVVLVTGGQSSEPAKVPTICDPPTPATRRCRWQHQPCMQRLLNPPTRLWRRPASAMHATSCPKLLLT